MKRKTLTLTAAATAAVLAAAAAFAGPSVAHGTGGGAVQGGAGMMGHMGYGTPGQAMGPGMMGHMGQGAGPGMMGYAPGASGDCPAARAALDKDLTVDDVTKILEHRLARWGNDRLKIGAVSEQGEDVIIGEIVTQDGSLVEKLAFDRHTGRATRSN